MFELLGILVLGVVAMLITISIVLVMVAVVIVLVVLACALNNETSKPLDPRD
jgi:hypothetical protein